jgi:hypothetical protein
LAPRAQVLSIEWSCEASACFVLRFLRLDLPRDTAGTGLFARARTPRGRCVREPYERRPRVTVRSASATVRSGSVTIRSASAHRTSAVRAPFAQRPRRPSTHRTSAVRVELGRCLDAALVRAGNAGIHGLYEHHPRQSGDVQASCQLRPHTVHLETAQRASNVRAASALTPRSDHVISTLRPLFWPAPPARRPSDGPAPSAGRPRCIRAPSKQRPRTRHPKCPQRRHPRSVRVSPSEPCPSRHDRAAEKRSRCGQNRATDRRTSAGGPCYCLGCHELQPLSW